MTSARPKSMMELIGNLCDERVHSGDMEALNHLLKTDPIAQEEYLDQALMDAILQWEFSAVAADSDSAIIQPEDSDPKDIHPDVSRGRLIGKAYLHAPLLVLLSIGTAFLWWIWPVGSSEQTIEIANASFEDDTVVSLQPSIARWYGDVAQIVQEVPGVSPYHGNSMLQMVGSTREPEDSCEVYQLIDLRDVAVRKRAKYSMIEASALVNSLSGDTTVPYVFSILLYALSDNPLEQSSPLPTDWESEVSYVGNQLPADRDLTSWQKIDSVLPYSDDMKFLLIKISVRGDTRQEAKNFPGQFVDHVTLRIKSFTQ